MKRAVNKRNRGTDALLTDGLQCRRILGGLNLVNVRIVVACGRHLVL